MAHEYKSIAQMALAIWREREMRFPERTRRMTPDAGDTASGAWDMCMGEALERFDADTNTAS